MIENRVDNPESISLYTLKLPSKAQSVTLVENLVDKLNDQYNFPDHIYANILTCVSEAANNAIIHGNKLDANKFVSIKAEIHESDLIFTISDEGPGFNYNDLPDPTDPENLENLTGRGIYIVRNLADQCIFNSAGNEVELHFTI